MTFRCARRRCVDHCGSKGISYLVLGMGAFGKLAGGAAVKSVVLSHLTWKADDDYSGWADEVKKHFSGPVLIAKDLNEF